MIHSRFPVRSLLPHLLRLGAGVCCIAAMPAAAAVLYWDPNGTADGTGGSGTWNTAGQLFRLASTTGSLASWSAANPNGDEVVFGGVAGTVSTTGNATLYANRLTFSTTGYTIVGGNSSANLTLTGAAPTITLHSGVTAKFSVLLKGSAATLAGSGTFQLGGNERIADNLALTISGATLDFNNSFETVGAMILVGGNLGATMNENGNLTAASYEVQSGTVSVRLHGAGGLRKTTDGTVSIRGTNDYTGTTLVEAGILALDGTDSLSKNAAVEVAGGTLQLTGYSQTATRVTLRSGAITGSGTLNASDASTAISVYSGSITANLQGTGLTKFGTGTVTIANQSDLRNGTTTVNGGILDLTRATILNTNRIDLNGGTLYAQGNQFQNTRVELNGGRLAPGGNLATASLSTGAEVWRGNSGFDFNIWNARGTAGSSWDSLSIQGGLDLTKLGSAGFGLKVIGLVGATGGTGLVANFTGNLTNPAGYSWTFVTASSGIAGFDASKFSIDLSAFTNPFTGAFSVVQSGNSLNLVFTPVPEPATYALALGAATLGVVGFRRWRRRTA